MKILKYIFNRNKALVVKPMINHLESDIGFSEKSNLSPYPSNLERRVNTRTGIEIFIRPIKHDDKSLLLELFDSLTPESRYFRFFSPMKQLPESMLERFTKIDYEKNMALVAVDPVDIFGKILATACFMTDTDQQYTEFAIVVRDEWHGKGLGRALLEHLILIARDKKIESMSGFVLAENTHMLSLGHKMGFSLSRVTGESYYILKIDLTSINNSGR